MSTVTAWDVRITNYDPAVPLDQLLSHPSNPKIHPRPQTDALKGILGEVGWLTGLIVNQTTGHLLDGHDRVKAAMQAGQRTAPVFYVAVPADQEAYVLATFDPVGALAGQDAALLADLLAEVQTGDAAVQALLDGLAGTPIDPAALWQGMPEFEQADLESWKSIKVHFANEQDYAAFAQLVNQTLTLRTKYIWYPYQQPADLLAYQVVDES